MTKSGTTKRQRITMSGTRSDNEWYNERQRVTTNDNEWQRVVILANFLFSWITEEPITMYVKETLQSSTH